MASEDIRPDLIDLISSYSILTSLSPWLSTLDLHNLSLTSRSAYSYIHSPKIFSYLTRQSLCDGHGLSKRQAYQDPFRDPFYTPGKPIQRDEEIEVHLYNVKCAEADALPCLKCGVNICEECRCYPRAAPASSYTNRRPHIRGCASLANIMCLCAKCDEDMEKELEGKFLNEKCDCDLYRRWICGKCEGKERKETSEYFEERTEMEWLWLHSGIDYGDDYEPSKTLQDHAFMRAFWCKCGKTVSHQTIPRCIWCKRRHLPEEQWDQERHDTDAKHPFFDDNPNYPRWVTDENNKYPTPYPTLGYLRRGDVEQFGGEEVENDATGS